MKRFYVLLLAICATLAVYAQPGIGSKAPDIVFSQCLNAPETAPDFYKNKYLVLDFWATWCGPCIAAFPHLDDLSKKFSSDSVVFAVISSEQKEKVEKFLLKRNISALHLLDSTSATSRASVTFNDLSGITAQNFSVKAIPYTVVIDKNNNMVWSGSASELTALDLNYILQNNAKKVIDARRILQNNALTKAQQMESIFAITPKQTLKANGCTLVTCNLPYFNYTSSGIVDKEHNIKYQEFGGQPISVYYHVYAGVPYNRIKSNVKSLSIYSKNESKLDVSEEVFNRTALELIAKAFRLEYKKRDSVVDVYELVIVDQELFESKSKPLDASSKHSSSQVTKQEFVFSNCTLERIGNALEDFLHTPVIIKDPSRAHSSCDMIIKKGEMDVADYLLSHYGIKLQKEKRSVEFVDIVQEL